MPLIAISLDADGMSSAQIGLNAAAPALGIFTITLFASLVVSWVAVPLAGSARASSHKMRLTQADLGVAAQYDALLPTQPVVAQLPRFAAGG